MVMKRITYYFIRFIRFLVVVIQNVFDFLLKDEILIILAFNLPYIITFGVFLLSFHQTVN
jgi:hypothetical protein